MNNKSNLKNMGLYIHIPFCKKKCEYCDFKSYSGKEDLVQEYIKWLEYEIEQIGKSNKQDYEENKDSLINLNTIYIGGGTPSVIDSKYIENILKTIKTYYNISDNVETTIEINPGTVNKEKLEKYLRSGINRLSIGLQSTSDRLLKGIGRIHTYDDFLNAYTLARKIGFKNINVDLMLALPDQSLNDLEESIDKVINLNPEHISVYSLIIEEGTPFFEKYKENKLNIPDDELERKMYWFVNKKLEKAGYIHYEISNFAKPNFYSKHNLACWNQEEYIGVGVAAHSYTNNVRYSNIDSIEEYIHNYKFGNETNNFVFHEKQNRLSKMNEYMMLGLRKINGAKVSDFKSKFGENPIFFFKEKLNKLVEEELLEVDGDYIRLTNKGIDLANLVWEEFV